MKQPWAVLLAGLAVLSPPVHGAALDRRQQASGSASASAATPSVNTTRPLGTRAHHGLNPDGMQHNSIYFGVLPDWSKEEPVDINKALGSEIAIIGDYIYISSPTSSQPFSQMSYHSPGIIRFKDTSVYAPAILPYFTLDQWTQDLSDGLAQAAASYNQQGMTVWLRFAYEQNGDWQPYGQDPTTYVSVWQQMANAVRANAQANATYLLWSPNVAGGDIDSVQGYTPYYPGDEFVDIAGLSYYWTGPGKRSNEVPDNGSFIDGFSSFYAEYGHKLPIVISETSAAYHYAIPSNYSQNGADTEVYDIPYLPSLTPIPASGSPAEVDMKTAWLEQMTGTQVASRFPNLTAISWFNYFKEANLSQFQDYRSIGGTADVESAFRSYVGNVTAYQGGFTGAASQTWPLGTLPLLLVLCTCIWTIGGHF